MKATTATTFKFFSLFLVGNIAAAAAEDEMMMCTAEYNPVVCTTTEGTKEVFSNMCMASVEGNYTNTADECKLIELLSVQCTNPYALCASSSCVVNADEVTASCDCYGFQSLSYRKVL